MATLVTRSVLSWQFATVLVLLLVTGMAARSRLDADPAAASKGDSAGFLAERALTTLTQLLGDEQPHPVDSPANERVRERIGDALELAGYRAEIQEASACSTTTRTCARVRNVIAVHEGSGNGKAILVSAHYDSVPAGPGASDNGANVAIMIEAARMLKQRPAGRNDVIFLFSDGEEAGLLGARAFASQHPLIKRVAAVINLEARGTSGQSILFETGTSSSALLDAFANTAKRPLANSLVAMAYKFLPNDTDLSVFKAAGLQGLNFAFGERHHYYHTSLDTLENLDPGSVQAQGDNLHELLLGLAEADLADDSVSGGMVYTDLLGFGMVKWPESWGPAIASFLLVAFGLVTWRLRKQEANGRGFWRGVFGFPAVLLLALVAGYLLNYLLSLLNGGASGWPSNTLANRIALWSVVVLVVVSAQRLLARRTDPFELWIGLVWAWLLVALALSIIAPGASYLFILPSAAAVACAMTVMVMAQRLDVPGKLWILLLPVLPAFVVFLPAVHLIEIMMGFNSIVGVLAMAGLLGLAMMFALPYAASAAAPRVHGAVTVLLVVGVAAGLVLSVRAPAFTADKPQALNIMYVQATDQKAIVTAGSAMSRPPATLLEAMGGKALLAQAFPWNAGRFWSIPVPSAGLPSATLVVLGEEDVAEGRRVTARIDAPADVYVVQLLIPEVAQLRSIETDGQRLDYSGDTNFPVSFICRGTSCNGRQLALTFGGAPFSATVVAMSNRLPDAAGKVARGRGTLAVPRNDGDQSVVISEVPL